MMCNPNISSTWLSAEMARALAALCPPLQPADMFQAAYKLSGRHVEPATVISLLLQPGTDLMQVRRVVEALAALRDLVADEPISSSKAAVSAGRRKQVHLT